MDDVTFGVWRCVVSGVGIPGRRLMSTNALLLLLFWRYLFMCMSVCLFVHVSVQKLENYCSEIDII